MGNFLPQLLTISTDIEIFLARFENVFFEVFEDLRRSSLERSSKSNLLHSVSRRRGSDLHVILQQVQ